MISRRRLLGLATTALVGSVITAGATTRSKPRKQPSSLRQHYPAIVVGSGYGGGISALRLAQQGIETLIIEKGRVWNIPDEDGRYFSKILAADMRSGWFTQSPPSLLSGYYPHASRDLGKQNNQDSRIQAGICDLISLGDQKIFTGVGLGGGSLMNSAVMTIPTIEQLTQIFPDIDPHLFQSQYIRRVDEQLRISYCDLEWFNQTAQFQTSHLIREYADVADYRIDYPGSSYSFNYLQREILGQVPPSAIGLEQQFGNNHGRFGRIDDTYIAAAITTGYASVSPLTEVLSIRQEPSKEYVVEVRKIDRWGNQIGRYEIGCDQLILAAGTINTVKLLLRARESGALENLSEEIGHGYATNGNVMVAHTIDHPLQTQQTLMGNISLDGRRNFDNPFYASIITMPLLEESAWVGYSVSLLGEETGVISYHTDKDSLSINWAEDYTHHHIERVQSIFDVLLQANHLEYQDHIFSEDVFVPYTLDPLGGCLRGQATDSFGRIRGYSNLYVNDASLIPGYIGCPPAMTIAALAERNIEAIIEKRPDPNI